MTTANLHTLPRKAFTLVLADGSEVPGQFGTWALMRLGQKRKLSLVKLGELFSSSDISLDLMIDLILCAVEYSVREMGKPLSFNDRDLCKWIDDTKDPNALSTLFSHSGSEDTEEKKSDPEQLSSGQNCSDLPPKQESPVESSGA